MSLEQATKHFANTKTETTTWFAQEIAGLRSSRVKPEAVESVTVEYYGAKSPLNSLASVSSLDARTLLISPWDKGAVVPIEKALTEAQLGAMPVVDGQLIRLSFPTLTQEVREHTIKQLHKKGEEARVRLRIGRDEALKIVRAAKDEEKVSEDDFYKTREKLDMLITEANEALATALKKKEDEIRLI